MLSVAKVLLLAFFDICRLVKRPQDIPASRNLLTLCLVLYGLLSIQLASLSQPLDKAVLAGVLEVVLIMLFSFALLQISGKSARWVQTVTALSGTGVIISIIALPLYLFIGIGSDNTVNSSGFQVFGLLFLAILACWNIAIMGHILRHALDINMFLAVVLAIAYIWIIFSFTAAIMPMEVN